MAGPGSLRHRGSHVIFGNFSPGYFLQLVLTLQVRFLMSLPNPTEQAATSMGHPFMIAQLTTIGWCMDGLAPAFLVSVKNWSIIN